jgi:hypothetical protein
MKLFDPSTRVGDLFKGADPSDREVSSASNRPPLQQSAPKDFRDFQLAAFSGRLSLATNESFAPGFSTTYARRHG